MKSTTVIATLCLITSLLAWNYSARANESKPIRIGATVSLEGPYKEPSLMIQKAFRLWESEINQQGGLLGRKVQLLLYNDKSQKALARDLYRKMIVDDGVDFVFSPYGTPLTLVASEISEKYKMIMLACAASGEVIWERGHRYVFGVYALANRYFIGLLDIMARNGHQTVSLIYNNASPFNVSVAQGVKHWANRFKISVAHEVSYNDGPKELGAIISDLKSAQAQRLIVSAYPPDCYHILNLMQDANYQPQIVGMTIAPIHPDFWENVGKMAQGVFGPSQWEPNERIPFPGTKQFVQAFKLFTGKTPSYHAGSAYAACQLFEKAVTESHSLKNDVIRDYLATSDTVTVIGRFKVDASGKQVGHNPILIQWQNGKKEIVWPTKMQTAPPLL